MLNGLFKKLFVIMATASSSVWAQVTVPIVWPYNPGSTQANYVRAIIEDANSQQQKYRFVFDHKPGAGTAIAMNHVANSQGPALVSNTATFFIRPGFFPNESHNIDNFEPLVTQMVGQPIAILSKKYSSLAELKKQTKLTVGTIPGSFNDLVTREFVKHALPGVDVVFVPFPGTPEIVVNILGGHLDAGPEFLAQAKGFVEEKKISVIGITGEQSYPNFPTFSSQGVRGLDKHTNYWQIYASKNMPESVKKELTDILTQANKNPKVVALYKSDFGIPVDYTVSQTKEYHSNSKSFWQGMFKNK